MQIAGFNKLTLLDYPGLLAATLFTPGCSLRCFYCHNSRLVSKPTQDSFLDEGEVFDFLKKRYGKLTGVCISGGEPTLQEELYDFIKKIKSLGYRVKLDTNGSDPLTLKKLLDARLLDMAAMDIKGSQEEYPVITQCKNINMEAIQESAALLMSYSASDKGSESFSYEFRSTILGGLHSEGSIHSIGRWLRGADTYVLQAYRSCPPLLNGQPLPFFREPSYEELERYRQIALDYFKNVLIRPN